MRSARCGARGAGADKGGEGEQTYEKKAISISSGDVAVTFAEGGGGGGDGGSGFGGQGETGPGGEGGGEGGDEGRRLGMRRKHVLVCVDGVSKKVDEQVVCGGGAGREEEEFLRGRGVLAGELEQCIDLYRDTDPAEGWPTVIPLTRRRKGGEALETGNKKAQLQSHLYSEFVL